MTSSDGRTADGYATKYGHAHLLDALRAAPRRAAPEIIGARITHLAKRPGEHAPNR
jgi:hypothetical protein